MLEGRGPQIQCTAVKLLLKNQPEVRLGGLSICTCSQSWLFSRSLAIAAATCAATSSLLERSADASSLTCSR